MLTTHAGPGHPGPLDGEIHRLVSLRDQLLDDAEVIDRLDPEGWRGTASDSFAEFRVALTKRWRAIGDLCDDAIKALESYHDSLVDVRQRMSAGDLPYGWQHELNPAADAVARQLRKINILLHDLGSLFDTPSPEAAQSPPPPALAWKSPGPPPRRVPAELSHPGDGSYSKDTEEVSHQLLHADFREIDVSFDDPKPPDVPGSMVS